MCIAIELLLHLVETMHRTRRIGVVGIIGVGELIRSRRQRGRALSIVADALVGRLAGLSGAAGEQVLIIGGVEAVFIFLDGRDVRGGRAGRSRRDAEELAGVGRRRSADKRGRQRLIGLLGRRQLISRRVARLRLRRLEIVRAGRSVVLDDAAREKVENRLVLMDRLIGRKHVIEAAVLANDDDYMLDRRGRISVVAPCKRRRDRICG